MPIALANIRSELLPGLFDVRGSYDMIPRQWDKVFKTHKSSMAVERSTQMAFVALPYLKDEGAATQFDNNAGERFTWAFVHIEVALGYAITRKAIDDNLYKAQFNPTNLKLQEAFAQFKEIQAANILNWARPTTRSRSATAWRCSRPRIPTTAAPGPTPRPRRSRSTNRRCSRT
jgi:hypothetical protein